MGWAALAFWTLVRLFVFYSPQRRRDAEAEGSELGFEPEGKEQDWR
jgi:hypothetical protein